MPRFDLRCLSTRIFFLSVNGIIRTRRVEETMLNVDRGKYAKHNPYMDAPQSIGYGVTISAPHMVSCLLFFSVFEGVECGLFAITRIKLFCRSRKRLCSFTSFVFENLLYLSDKLDFKTPTQ